MYAWPIGRMGASKYDQDAAATAKLATAAATFTNKYSIPIIGPATTRNVDRNARLTGMWIRDTQYDTRPASQSQPMGAIRAIGLARFKISSSRIDA